MANGPDRYARPLMERSVLRRCMTGLIVIGACTIPMGIWADNVFVVTGGVIGVMGAGVWRLWLAIPDP